MRRPCGHMVALLTTSAIWMIAIMMNMTMQFNNDESVAELRQYEGTGCRGPRVVVGHSYT